MLWDKKKEKEKGWKSKNRASRQLAVLAMSIWLSGVSAGCGAPVDNNTKVVLTTGFAKDEIFRIEGISCRLPEIMVYLTNSQNQYESVYGPEIWKANAEGVTLEQNIKDTALARIAQIKTMNLLAKEHGVELSDQETEMAKEAAKAYFSSLNDTEKGQMGVTEEVIAGLYAEYALANKVYQFIIRDINPEISDDEARTITVQHILLRTSTVDGAGNRVDYSEERRQEAYRSAAEIRRQAVQEEQDFVDLATRYSEDDVISCSFGKGEMDAAFEEAAFALETGEVSQVVETEDGYEIIKCLSTFDREQTDISKQEIVEERRREVFGQEYDEFVDTLVRNLNTRLWEEITLIHDPEVTTTGFFEIYAEYFSSS